MNPKDVEELLSLIRQAKRPRVVRALLALVVENVSETKLRQIEATLREHGRRSKFKDN